MRLLLYRIIIFTLILPLFLCEIQHKVTNKVYFDVDIGGKDAGRIEIGLFGEVVPKTVKNFKTIATTGIYGKTYAGTMITKVIKEFKIEAGDILNNNGSGTISIYGPTFKDENFEIKHTGPGYLSMANSGPDTNGCQFYILLAPAPWLDDQQVVFGKIVKGGDIVSIIEDQQTDTSDRPIQDVLIRECGEIKMGQAFLLSESAYSLAAWIKAGIIPLSFSFALMAYFHWVFKRLDSFQLPEKQD